MTTLSFNAPVTNPFGLTNVGYWSSPTFVDIDNDGDLDAFVGNDDGNTLFFQNTGSVTNPVFDTAVTNPFGLTNVGWTTNPTFVDIEGDGDLDAFIGESYGSTVFFQNTGTVTNPIFDTPAINPFGLSDVGWRASPTFVDINNDGNLDAFVGEFYGDTLFYQNIGTVTNPVFDTAVANPFGLTNNVGLITNPTFIDIDGDGDLDAFVGNYQGNTLFFQNTGTVTNPIFDTPVINPLGLTNVGSNANPTFVDINNDGNLDAFVGEYLGNIIFFKGNHLAVGSVTITGNLVQGQTLTAINDIADTDGLGAFTYQWLADGNIIAGATADSYTLTQDEGSKTIQVIVSYVDGHGTTERVASAISSAVIPVDSVYNGTTGNDTLISGLANDTLNGVAGNDSLVGNLGNDILNGGVGADAMNGGGGDDSYYVDNRGDVITEYGNEGNDTVLSNLNYLLIGTELENVSLTGTALYAIGNDYNNRLTGNASANLLDGGLGNDTLNGGAGADQLIGHLGNDTYFVDNVNDSVNELGAEGIDTVSTSMTYTLPVNVENLTLTGTLAVNGTGNDSANNLTGNTAANALDGGLGNDTLNGGTGADTMTGGAGNDTYYVDNANDVITEAAGAGTDTVLSSLNYSLVNKNTENLTLTGTSANTATGNSSDNILIGNLLDNSLNGGDGNDSLNGGAGVDQLIGGLGNDTLVGGTGSDSFVFDSALSATNIDKLTDFSVIDDTIKLENALFTKVGLVGVIDSAYFKSAPLAVDNNDYVVYNKATGALYYDADANGANAAVQIAIIGTTTHPALTYADIVVI